MAEGARIAEAQGADIIDINMGCPAKQVTNGAVRLGADARSRSCADLIEATVAAVQVPVTLKMRLGWDASHHQCAGARAPRRGCRRQADHRARPHALPVLQRHAPIGPRCAPSSRRCRFPSSSMAISNPATMPSQRLAASGADAVMIGRARAGPPVAAGPDRALPRDGRARASAAAWRISIELIDGALRRDAGPSRPARSAAAMRASISAGRSIARRRQRRRRRNAQAPSRTRADGR